MLVLASESPRRQEILARAGIAFAVRPARVEEERLDGENAREHVSRLARSKAEAVTAGPDEIVLGADTVVVVDGQILGKPTDSEDAARMLRQLSGREHFVMTGICLRSARGVIVDVETTRVRFAALSDRDIQEYVASGEPLDKAGAYGVQGLASKFVERIEGCYLNVVGLPMALVYKYLRTQKSHWYCGA